MTTLAVQVAIGVLVTGLNLVWVALRGGSLVSRYLPDSRFGALNLLWGTALSGACALYVGTLGVDRHAGGWGFIIGDAAVWGGGTVIGIGVSIVTFGWLSILIDSRVQRLPDELTILMALQVGALVLTAPWLLDVSQDWFPSILAGAIVWTVPLALGNRFGQVGAGDVKLAPVLGAALASSSFCVALLGLAAAFVTAAIQALFMAVRPETSRRFSFGPHLLGCAIACWALATLGPMALGPGGV